jgi:DNA mismatch repair protein MutL
MDRYRKKESASQMLCPALIVSLSLAEETLLKDHLNDFRMIGFEIEPFGGHDYLISAVPQDLFGLTEREYFLEMLDRLSADTGRQSIEQITASVATMACKAAVKGNTRLSFEEADALIGELLTLDNPYNCPHGRPTIISMSKYEIEKKFRRIV